MPALPHVTKVSDFAAKGTEFNPWSEQCVVFPSKMPPLHFLQLTRREISSSIDEEQKCSGLASHPMRIQGYQPNVTKTGDKHQIPEP